MYLHLGQDMVVPSRTIVGIFDIENTTTSKFTRQFLADAEKGKRFVLSAALPVRHTSFALLFHATFAAYLAALCSSMVSPSRNRSPRASQLRQCT